MVLNEYVECHWNKCSDKFLEQDLKEKVTKTKVMRLCECVRERASLYLCGRECVRERVSVCT